MEKIMGKTLFSDMGISVRGKVLSREETRFFLGEGEVKFNPGKMKAIVEEAEGILGEDIPVLTLSLYRRFYIDGNRSAFESKHHRRRHCLFILMLAEYYEGEGRFIEKIADYVWAICEETTWVLPAHHPAPGYPRFEEDRAPNEDLYAAVTAALLGMTFYLLGDKLDALDTVIRQRCEHLVGVRLVEPLLTRMTNWEKAQKPNNWLPDIYKNTLIATALVDDMETRERILEKVEWGLDRFVSGYPDDGCCDEGAGYWGGAAGALFTATELIYDLTGGRVSVFDNKKFRDMGEYISKMYVGGTSYVNFSDCNFNFKNDSSMIMRYGKRSGSRNMESFGKYMLSKTGGFMHFSMTYAGVRMLMYPDMEAPESFSSERSVWLPGHKVALFRECTDGAKGFLLAAKGGSNAESHNHNDVGNFIVTYDGAPVIIDAGMGTYCRDYFSPFRSEFWNIRSSYHSLPSFDGIEQLSGEEFRSSDEVCDAEAQSLYMELKSAYPDEAGVLRYGRTLSLSDGKIRVREQISLERERQIDFHLLTKNRPAIAEDGVMLLSEGRRLIYDPSVLSASFEAVVAPGRQPSMNIKGVCGVDALYRIILSAKASEIDTEIVIE